MMFWKEFGKRLTSRKFLLAFISAFVVFANKYWDWGLSEVEVIALVSGFLTFIAGESWIDSKRAEL